jgi:hypothetical protein
MSYHYRAMPQFRELFDCPSYFIETSVSSYWTACHYVPEDESLHCHRCQDVKYNALKQEGVCAVAGHADVHAPQSYLREEDQKPVVAGRADARLCSV